MSMNRRKFVAALPAALLLSAQKANASPSGLGVIFVAQSTCPYCAAIAPVLKQLQDETGIDVLLASMDLQPVLPFTSFEDGLRHPLTAHFQSVPQVLIFNGKHQRITHHVGGVRTMRHFLSRLSSALRESSVL
ncbi:conjugal transfer protein TraF [Loktanella sp. Alg231-35]|uniref:conjugal transfer protein TraF n=1 Tax=Loktanella sp. Alg231-35 TaxID=1922220 RepID=UPI000D559FCD|nr:conjugal transfer protein TraF [Loktanella sp. Alg231-35]